MSRQENKINQIVGIKGGAIWILEDVFQYSDDFKGATGYSMNTLTQDYIDDMNDIENLTSEYDYLWREAVQGGHTELGLNDYMEFLINENECYGGLYVGDDDSYRYETEKLIDELPEDHKKQIEKEFGVLGKDYVTWQVSSGGRCFNADDEWDVIFRPDLVELIKEYETK